MVVQLRQAPLDGFAMAIEKSSDIGDAAMSKFESLIGGVESPLTFIERSIGNKHRLFHGDRVRDRHDGFLPDEKIRSQSRPAYHPNAVPKIPNGTFIKFQMLRTILHKPERLASPSYHAGPWKLTTAVIGPPPKYMISQTG